MYNELDRVELNDESSETTKSDGTPGGIRWNSNTRGQKRQEAHTGIWRRIPALYDGMITCSSFLENLSAEPFGGWGRENEMYLWERFAEFHATFQGGCLKCLSAPVLSR